MTSPFRSAITFPQYRQVGLVVVGVKFYLKPRDPSNSVSKGTNHHSPSRYTSGIILDNKHSHRRQQALTAKQLIGKTN
jgi:hypothetical protein